MTFALEMPKKASAKMLTMYRALPITVAQRGRLKGFLFTFFGFAFARMDAYKRWKEYRLIQDEWPAAAPVAQITTLASSFTQTALHGLPTADGTWEWADYDVVKSRIAQVKGSQLAQVAPSALGVINIGSEPFASAVARVRLPAPPDMPDVSIILPVFNNLKITLECLLSISAHTDGRTSFEIILADDASTDETAQFVGMIANLRVIHNEQNLGFLRNCNKALEYVRGRDVLYLNNDVQVTPGWLENLHDTFSRQHNVGAAGAKFVYPSGHLQEAGVAFRHDGTADMVGLNDDAARPRYNYIRRVDYISGACLMIPTDLARKLGGFSEDFLPCYCEDSDLCLRVQAAGYYVYYNPAVIIIHHLSKTTAAFNLDFKLKSIAANLVKLRHKWIDHLDRVSTPKIIAFYLPQFHPFPENDSWWGSGFTEWTNVTKAQPNFLGHYQPRLPADLGFYDLRIAEVMQQQAELAQRYGVHGFCFYYYWFSGKRLLEQPIEQMLETGEPDMPFCLCWANENWTRRWDGQDHEILIAQNYSAEDDIAVINDLIRFFRDRRYIRIDGRPMILVYRVTLFPDFCATVARWRNFCRKQGIGEIYVAMVESMELVHANKHPHMFGCDAAVEFPPFELAEQKPPSGNIINHEFNGSVADYRDIAVRFATREFPGYTRFKGVMPGWDNTARRQNMRLLAYSSLGLKNPSSKPGSNITATNAWCSSMHGTNGQRALILSLIAVLGTLFLRR
jgi:GT2 family glycosyltransferase